MNVLHLTASTFYGGPERQILGLCRALADADHNAVLSFSEGGRCREFLAEARRQGVAAGELEHDTPCLKAAVGDLAAELDRLDADVLLCNGYKANLLGRLAARRMGIRAVAVSRGWTAESWRVRLYEGLDRLHLGWMDQVVCVSEAQARKVRRTGVRPERITAVCNAVDAERFENVNPTYRAELLRYFSTPPRWIVGAAGRLSPEKGFGVLAAAAERVVKRAPNVGFIVFGEGASRRRLERQILNAGLGGKFLLPGFRGDLDHLLPFFDLLALSSFTEGMPNVVLEAFAAGVPVVSTAVGGAPELVEEGVTGFLVPAGDPTALADRILNALASEERRHDMGAQGRRRVLEQFTFAAQAVAYRRLFAKLGIGRTKDKEDLINSAASV
jgi:glycosyltransferase involved in cell wall biosynthesis